MEKTSKKSVPETLAETLQRLIVQDGRTYTFPVSLLRSKKSGQVLYLEAGKDFVDTLLSFLLLPLGTIIRVRSAGIQVNPALGGISSIFESVQNFSVSDLQVAKDHLMRPRPAAIGCNCRSSGLAMQRALETISILPRRSHKPRLKPGLFGNYYKCCGCYSLVQSLNGGYCRTCSKNRSTFSSFPGTAYSVFEKEIGYKIGFLKANTTFIVIDNLEIMPLTTKKFVYVLSKLNVDSLADLEGNDITVSLIQILQLLNSALTSNNCLNEVFGKSKWSSLRWCANSVASVAVSREIDDGEASKR